MVAVSVRWVVLFCPDGDTGAQMGPGSSSGLPGKSRAALSEEPTTVLTIVLFRGGWFLWGPVLGIWLCANILVLAELG